MLDWCKRNVLLLGIGAQAVLAAIVLVREPWLLLRTPVSAGGVFVGLGVGALLYVVLTRDGTLSNVRAGLTNVAFAPLVGIPFLVAAVAEEILWRGWAFHALSRQGLLAAFVLTSIGFAAVHVFARSFAGVRTHLLTGAGFGVALLSTGSLAAAICAHVLYNELTVLAIRHKLQERNV
jgi:membrane protease YdiL (CAAX protease family)